MTQMPELVALMHSLVGLAAMLVGYANFIDPAVSADLTPAENTIHEIEMYLGVLIGAVTFSGSVIAFGKLSARITGKPVLLPGRHLLNLAGLLVVIYFGYAFVNAHGVDDAMTPMIVMTVVALLFGVHMVMAIGGADMPVVVSMLNSYSGWAAAATGFMLNNDLLIVTGALVGSSGAILSYIMCAAMNRHFLSVIAGGFGTDSSAPAAAGAVQPAGEVNPILAAETAELLRDAKNVIIVPGYGMAVAQAQHTVNEITQMLRGARASTCASPSIRSPGRMPGHMNVLLAEAKVPYDIVFEMDETQRRFPEHRRRHGHRRQRHRQSGGARRSDEPHRRHAGARGVEGQALDRHEAQHGLRLRRRRQSALLQGQQPDALRRREEDAGRGPGRVEILMDVRMCHAGNRFGFARRIGGLLAIAAIIACVASASLVRAQSWSFGAPPSGAAEAWSAERGTLTPGDGEARLQPDANRRVVLLSPPGLPESVRAAEKFVVQIGGSGLKRVRIQARRDARGGWLTIADASGSALLSTAAGYVVKRNPGARDGAIERLRIELEFRTTNPRELKHIAVVPPKR